MLTSRATILTQAGLFTPGIEGPACDGQGLLYAVNFAAQGSIGVVTSEGQAYHFVQLPEGSTGNGIRFDSKGDMLVADCTGHKVLKVEMRSRKVSIYADQPVMHQPNDLCISAEDLLFASDPDWAAGSGRIWRVNADGSSEIAAEELGTTNGIEIAPDEATLYVNESVQRRIWAFDLKAGQLSRKRLFHEFPDHGLDGMRCDVEGRLYVTRYDKGTVALLDPHGQLLGEVSLTGKKPSNLCFGGEDGCTVYVTLADQGNVESFRVDVPGREWVLSRRYPKGAWDR